MTRWRGLIDSAEGSRVLVLFHDCQLVSGDMLWSPDDDSDHIAFLVGRCFDADGIERR